MHAIFEIPEIVEPILLALPVEEVLTNARAVCRLWTELIETSPSLQYYTTVGLPVPALKVKARGGYKKWLGLSAPPITTLAFDVISLFWKRLIAKVMVKPPLEPDIDSAVLLPTFRELYQKFLPVFKRVSFFHPVFEFLNADWRTNWEYGHQPRISKKDMKEYLTSVLPPEDELDRGSLAYVMLGILPHLSEGIPRAIPVGYGLPISPPALLYEAQLMLSGSARPASIAKLRFLWEEQWRGGYVVFDDPRLGAGLTLGYSIESYL